jgi:hypothetical protein
VAEGRGRRRRGVRTSPPVVPIGNGDGEGWERDVEDQDLRGVAASRSAGVSDVWQVEVAVAELIREAPLEAELRRGIETALRTVPGVVAVEEEDRETWLVTGIVDGRELVRTAGAVVDALAPRAARRLDELERGGTDGGGRDRRGVAGAVGEATLERLADPVAPLLEAYGFAREEHHRRSVRFRRYLDHGVEQGVTLTSMPRIDERGRVQPAQVWIIAGVLLPPRDPATREDLRDLAGGWSLDHQTWAAPTAAAVESALVERILPWLTGTAGRAALAAWAGADPTRIVPPVARPRVAELLAGWGFAAEARTILGFLDAQENRYLATRPEANRARRLLGGP